MVLRATVGVTETCQRLEEFVGENAADQAAEYISTLPDHDRGIYYLDVITDEDDGESVKIS